MKQGVTPSAHWLPLGNWSSLLDYLKVQFPEISEEIWLKRLQKKEVVSESGEVYHAHSLYPASTRIYYYREIEDEPRIPFYETILFEDEHIVVVDKPHFIPVVPSGRFLHQSLLVRLKHRLNLPELSPIHRIDRETAGLVVFCKNEAERGGYQNLFADRKVNKTYVAIAPINLELTFPLTFACKMVEANPFFRMKKVHGEANSETWIEQSQKLGDYALYTLKPVTGKKHQLRVHLAALNIPILNDPYYPELRDWDKSDFKNPLKLLAKKLEFIDPFSGETRCFESQLDLTLDE